MKTNMYRTHSGGIGLSSGGSTSFKGILFDFFESGLGKVARDFDVAEPLLDLEALVLNAGPL